jgi:hypothetical protein
MLELEPMVDATPLLADPAALRSRAAEDGYLYFKGLLEPGKVLEVRRQMVQTLVRHGYVDAKPGLGRERVIHEAVAAQPKDQVIEQCMTFELYRDIQKLEVFHALPHDPVLLSLYESLFGEPPLPHPRNIARVIMPGKTFFPTPPHQDYPIVQGAADTWTGWIPLAATPRALGPLAVMPGSHKHGVFETMTMPGAGGTGAKIAHLPPRWATADFEPGDVLAFHCLTVHRALPQEDRDRLRLSMDVRYQPVSQPIHALSLRPHLASYTAFNPSLAGGRPPGWDELYKGWADDTLKYYWRKYDLRLSDYEVELLPFVGLDAATRQMIKARLDDRAGL